MGPLRETHADRLADPSRLPDMQIQRRQELERLRRALMGLPEKYRVIVELRDLQELSILVTARSLSPDRGNRKDQTSSCAQAIATLVAWR